MKDPESIPQWRKMIGRRKNRDLSTLPNDDGSPGTDISTLRQLINSPFPAATQGGKDVTNPPSRRVVKNDAITEMYQFIDEHSVQMSLNELKVQVPMDFGQCVYKSYQETTGIGSVKFTR